MPVTSKHPKWQENIAKWSMIENVISGTAGFQPYSSGLYTPMTTGVEQYILPPENRKDRKSELRRYKYITMAIFNNYTVNTLSGLVGTAMQVDPEIDLPPELEYMRDEATGNKLKLTQLILETLTEVVKLGRVVLFVDYPPVPVGLTVDQTNTLAPRARIYVKKAESVINWHVDKSKGTDILDLVVFEEQIEVLAPDGFEYQNVCQYRVLRLDKDGYYNYTILDHKGAQLIEQPAYPLQNGKKMDHIPAYCVGAVSNDWNVDASPLFPIAHTNIGHYRNSANLEDNADAHGQGTLFLTSDLTPSQWKTETDKRPIVMGSREGYFLGSQGHAELCQLEPNNIAIEMMKQKEEQMIMMGAHIMTPANANAPVETTRLQMGAKISRLDTLVSNTEDGIEPALRDCAGFEGANPDLVEVQMSHDFVPENANPLVMRELAAQWQAGAIPLSILLDYDRKIDLIPRDTTNEDIVSELATESPIGAGQGFNNPASGNPTGFDKRVIAEPAQGNTKVPPGSDA